MEDVGHEAPGKRGDIVQVQNQERTRRRIHGLRSLALIGCSVLVLPVTAAAEPRVTVEGGVETDGNNYSWTVTNHHDSPIVFAEFPHYGASLFFAPAGWSHESTFLVNVGVADKPGVCRATAETRATGIFRGDSAKFGMKVGSAKARPTPGTVRFRFDDGQELEVTGVELPQPQPRSEAFVSLISLSLIFGIVVLVQVFRSRRKRGQPAT